MRNPGKPANVSAYLGGVLQGTHHVEEREVLLLLDEVAELLPLSLGGINTGRVVCTSVQQDDGTLGRSLDIRLHTLKVESNGRLVKVLVLLDLQSRVFSDWDVVTPCRGGEIDGLGSGVVSGQEGSTDSKSSGTGDGLCDG